MAGILGLESAITGVENPRETNQYGIRMGAKDYASQTNARIARSNYYNWLNEVRPIQQELIASYNNPAQREAAAAQARGLVSQGFDIAADSNARRMQGLGVALTPEQQASQERGMNLRRGLADVNAFNQTMRRFDDRDASILYGAPSRSIAS